MNDFIIFKSNSSQELPSLLADSNVITDISITSAELSDKYNNCRYMMIFTDQFKINTDDLKSFITELESHDGVCAGYCQTKDHPITKKFEHFVFSFAYNGRVSEKICNLVAFPIQYWDELKNSIKGNDPLLSLLFFAARRDISIKNIPLNNAPPISRSIFKRITAYFNVFWNSQPLKYLFSSVVAFIIDYTLLMILSAVLPFASMEIGALLAWCVSSSTNFFLNRNFVFMADTPVKVALLEYYGLATTAFVLKTYVFIEIFTRLLHIPLSIAKPIAEVVFYLVNYFVQKKLIFKKKSDN